MSEITGKLEKFKKFGIYKDLEVVVSGKRFYDKNESGIIPEGIERTINKNVKVIYEERKTGLLNYLFDGIIFTPLFRLPNKYNAIIEIKILK